MATPHIHYMHYPQPFELTLGGSLAGFNLAYETWGTLNNTRDNAILLFPGLSASSHAASHDREDGPGWWEGMIGPGSAIDTNRWFVICANHLGGCFGSSGPSSRRPDSDKRYGPDFPPLMIQDISHAAHHLVRFLGIEKLHAVVGTSMGSLLAMEYAAAFADDVANLIAVSGSGRPGPQSIAYRFVQRQVILNHPDFEDGNYYDNKGNPTDALAVARMIGNITYRSAEEFSQRFGRMRTPEGWNYGPDFQVESYLNHMGRKLAHTFDANSFLLLSKAMDLYSLGYDLPSFEEGVLRIKARSLMIGVSTDMLFPHQEQSAVQKILKRAGRDSRFELLESVCGHDAFLVEVDWFGGQIAGFLNIPG